MCKFKSDFLPFENTGVIYSIPCENCNHVYIGESGSTGNFRISEHKHDYKKGKPKSKLVIHSLETDHSLTLITVKLLNLIAIVMIAEFS